MTTNQNQNHPNLKLFIFTSSPYLPSNLHDEYKHHQANKDQGPAKSPTQYIDLSLKNFEKLCREMEIINELQCFSLPSRPTPSN